MNEGRRRALTARLSYTVIGLALSGIGIGWHGRPPDDVIVRAIRARSPANALKTITLQGVTRNWLHEIFGTSTSQFLVTVTLAPPDGPAATRCFGVEPGLAGTAIALGPYAGWRCDFPF
jgi:hypothetical protein